MLKYLIEKEFKQIMRNAIIPKMILAYPIMVLLIFPWAINFEVKNIKISIVDQDKSTFSQRLMHKIDASKYFMLETVSENYEAAIEEMEKGKCDIILQIPSAFEHDLMREKNSNVMISANAVNGTQGLLGNSYLTQIVRDFSDEIRYEEMPILLQSNAPRIEVVPDYRFNKELDYKDFMLPAFIVLMITLICGIVPSLNIVTEKETGTIQQINATPVTKFKFILAKLIPFWIIGLIILTISFFLLWIIYGLLPTGSFVWIFLAAIIFIIGISGFGIIISNYSDTLQQSMFLVMFFILIIILLSGMFTPVESMPLWAQIIAYANPLTYFIEIMRWVYLKGSGFFDILKPLGILLAFALGLNAWAILSYRKSN